VRSFRRSPDPPSRHAHAPTVVLDGQSMDAMPTISAMFDERMNRYQG
jgi:hypothetical protein